MPPPHPKHMPLSHDTSCWGARRGIFFPAAMQRRSEKASVVPKAQHDPQWPWSRIV